VDHSREMLEQARSNLHSRGIHHATLRSDYGEPVDSAG
jgi:hypothetical protein